MRTPLDAYLLHRTLIALSSTITTIYKPTMKYLILSLNLALSKAFVVIPTARSFRVASLASSRLAVAKHTEEHLKSISDQWLELQRKEKELEKNLDDDVSTCTRGRISGKWLSFTGSPSLSTSCHLSHIHPSTVLSSFQTAAYELAKEMLELAIDAVQTQEVVELDHAAAAHQALEEAVNEEKALENAAKELHHDAEDADAILDTYESQNILEDLEERREMAISDIAHHVENYVETRLKAAREKERMAKGEEEEAKGAYERLLNNEDNLWDTLYELKDLIREKTEKKP